MRLLLRTEKSPQCPDWNGERNPKGRILTLPPNAATSERRSPDRHVDKKVSCELAGQETGAPGQCQDAPNPKAERNPNFRASNFLRISAGRISDLLQTF